MHPAVVHSLFLLVPLGLASFLALFIWRGKPLHPPTFKMTDSWTHAPILWASAEPADHGHGGHHGDHVTVGGGASGKW